MRLRAFAVIAAGVLLLPAAGCGGDKPAPQSPAQASPQSSARPGGPASSAPPSPPTDGTCVLMPLDRAATLLGSGTKGGPLPKTTATARGLAGGKAVDACSFSGSAGSLTYTVIDWKGSGSDPRVLIQHNLAGLGKGKKFEVTGGDAAVGHTSTAGGRTTATIDVAQGSYTLAVTAVRADATGAELMAQKTTTILLEQL